MSSAVYGRHSVEHLLKAGRRRARKLFIQKGFEPKYQSIFNLCRMRSVPVAIESENFFKSKFGDQAVHQGICLEADDYPYAEFESLFDSATILLLDGIEDPQNLGAACRTAYLFGVSGVVIPKNRAAGVNSTVCRASAGAVEYLKIAVISSLAQALERLKEAGFWSFGADATGTKNIYDADLKGKVALVLGGEGKGLGKLVRERCDFLVKIPMSDPNFGSFNTSVAGGVLLYEVTRQKLCQTR